MRVSVNEKIKVVSFWLLNNEEQDDEKIDILFDKYKKDNKYRKVVYKSGTGDLFYNTKELLKNNNG